MLVSHAVVTVDSRSWVVLLFSGQNILMTVGIGVIQMVCYANFDHVLVTGSRIWSLPIINYLMTRLYFSDFVYATVEEDVLMNEAAMCRFSEAQDSWDQAIVDAGDELPVTSCLYLNDIAPDWYTC